MAGKFLLLEEAAKRLGVTADEIHRLVEKKKLFPLRDGTALKFKVDEIERLAADGASDDVHQQEPGTDTFELDLDTFQPGSDVSGNGPVDSLVVGSSAQAESLVLGGSGSLAGDGSGPLAIEPESKPGAGSAASQDAPRPAQAPSGDDDLAQTMLGTGGVIDAIDGLELDLDSVIGLSSPSAEASAASAAKPVASASGAAADDSGTLNVDLSDVAIGSQPSDAGGSNATGSLVLGSGSLASGVSGSGASGSGKFGSDPLGLGPSGSDPAAPPLSGSLVNAGASLSAALDSGLSLEDDDAAVSGIDLGPLDAGQLAEDGATALAGEEFDLGTPDTDDDSASVVAVETGDSSFFSTTGGESSDFTGDVPLGSGVAADLGDVAVGDVVPDTKFSAWQISGLVCCTLLLLTGGFVMFDLMRTIGSPDDLTLSSPLLNPIANVFGWR